MLPQLLDRVPYTFAVALARTSGSATWAQLAKRQVPAQDTVSGFAESGRDGDHQWRLAIASGSVGQKHGGLDLRWLVQPAAHTRFFKSLRVSICYWHVCYV
jgi:hypothetical protein